MRSTSTSSIGYHPVFRTRRNIGKEHLPRCPPLLLLLLLMPPAKVGLTSHSRLASNVIDTPYLIDLFAFRPGASRRYVPGKETGIYSKTWEKGREGRREEGRGIVPVSS